MNQKMSVISLGRTEPTVVNVSRLECYQWHIAHLLSASVPAMFTMQLSHPALLRCHLVCESNNNFLAIVTYSASGCTHASLEGLPHWCRTSCWRYCNLTNMLQILLATQIKISKDNLMIPYVCKDIFKDIKLYEPYLHSRNFLIDHGGVCGQGIDFHKH